MAQNSVAKNETGGLPKSVWIVTYRGTDGKPETLQLEATDRADVFRQLEEKRLTAIKVEAASGKRKHAHLPGGSGSFVNKGLIAIGIASIIGAFAAWRITANFPDEQNREEEKKPSQIATTGPATIRVSDEERVERHPIKTSSVEEALANVGDFERPAIISSRPPISDEEMYSLTNRTFSTGVEQLMSWVFTTTVGDMPMPLPAIAKEEIDNIVGILMSKNEATDNDDEMTANCKETVAMAKRELIEYLKEGGDPEEFLTFYHNELRRAFEYRNLVLEQAREIYEEDSGLGEEFVNAINEKLGESGIRPLIMGEVR